MSVKLSVERVTSAKFSCKGVKFEAVIYKMVQKGLNEC